MFGRPDESTDGASGGMSGSSSGRSPNESRESDSSFKKKIPMSGGKVETARITYLSAKTNFS